MQANLALVGLGAGELLILALIALGVIAGMVAVIVAVVVSRRRKVAPPPPQQAPSPSSITLSPAPLAPRPLPRIPAPGRHRHAGTAACGLAHAAIAGHFHFARPKPPSVAEVAQLFLQLETLELLGVGGMGAVYKARQPQLDRFVALKLMPQNSAATRLSASASHAKARALAKLNHPNIVNVFDSGIAGATASFLMEFMDGTNLRTVMRAGEMTPREALAIVPKVCDALQYAHDEGIVHRHIKPENILLDTKGRVKIADFGLAKVVSAESDDFTLTATGMTLGTPRCMATRAVRCLPRWTTAWTSIRSAWSSTKCSRANCRWVASRRRRRRCRWTCA
jgi:tRNA A-37 threonylcarbamoyl transferase component Bud32